MNLAPYLISLTAGLGALVLVRDEPVVFRTGLACAALAYTAGVIAMIQQNFIGVGLILSGPCIMALVTALTPRESSPIADASAGAPPKRKRSSHRQGASRRSVGIASGAIAVLVVAFTAQAAVHHGMTMQEPGKSRQLAAHHVLPYDAVVDFVHRNADFGLKAGVESACVSSHGSAATEETACGAAELGR